MSTGLLMGAQDSSAIKGELLYDLAPQGETFQGMRKEVKCHEGELVLRDSEGIIAALFQGPDHRTRLKKETKDIVFFIFSVPGIAPHEIREGIEAVRALFQGACAALDAQLYEK
jgi:DNA/RNA-binding domain of Phe-tRNA-synthetase-like protein